MKSLFFTLLLILTVATNAQNYKYGKVSEGEILEKSHPLEPNADAAVLYKSEKIYFVYASDGFNQMREVHERIKIYNKEGFDWATKRIVLYRGGGGSNEILKKVQGETYNIEGGKISKDKLSKQAIFEEDVNDFIRTSTFTMPNIKEGSVIEYSYVIESPFLAIDDVILQYEVPINQLEVSIATPEYYRYNKTFNPKSQFYPVIKESQENKSASIVSTSRSSTSMINASNNYSQSQGTYIDYRIEINENNIPALKDEELISSLDNYRAKLGMELTAIQQSGGGFRTLSTTWEKVCDNIYNSPSFGEQIKRSNFYTSDIEPITETISDPFAKAFILQNFVRTKVKWNGMYGFTSPNGIRNAYKEGTGNVGDINLLLISMLQSSNVNAYPVLVSTRNNGIPLFPTQNGFNYVICMVETDEGYALFDATENFSSFNVLPPRAINWQGRVLRPDGSSRWVNLTPSKPSVQSTSLNVTLKDDFSAVGVVRKRYTDYLAFDYRNKYAFSSDEDHIKKLESGNGSIEISELNFENAKDVTKPVDISYKYELQDAVENIGDNLYLQPMLFTAMKESPFKADSRLYPIDFTYPVSEKYIINIMLPDGYEVETLPQSEALNFKDEACMFTYISKVNGKYLQLNISLDINTTIISTTDYAEFKAFFDKIIEKQNEQVVLKKV